MVICLERGADLHIAQLMPLPLTVSCFSKIQIGFTFLVPAHPGSPGQRAVKRVCVWYNGIIMDAFKQLLNRRDISIETTYPSSRTDCVATSVKLNASRRGILLKICDKTARR